MAYDPDPGVSPVELPGDPFDEFETIGEVCAFVYSKCGEDALRELLARPIPGHPYTREDLLDCASELKSAGLSQVAAIVTDLSSNALPMDDMSFCVYTPDVPANVTAWLRSTRSRQQERQAAREERLKLVSRPGRKPKAKP
jgi:hypothetical protein